MIRFFYNQPDKKSAAIIEVFEELCLAHEAVAVNAVDELPEALAAHTDLPLLVDGKAIVSGYEHIFAHLEKLKAFHAEWTRFQSDSCYCDKDGNII